MTVEFETGASPGTGSEKKSDAARMADTASSEVSHVGAAAAEGAKQVAGEASVQTKAVVGQAKQQIDSLLSQSREEVRQQAETRSAQAASGLRNLSEQVAALADGRSDSAGSLPRYLEDAQEQVRKLATRLEQDGPQGVMDDMTRFARRRPGLFLAGAVGAGFLVGRLVRASSGQSDQSSSQFRTPQYSSPQYSTTPRPSAAMTAGPVVTTSPEDAGMVGTSTSMPSAVPPDPGMLP